jgi:hypothetical protein
MKTILKSLLSLMAVFGLGVSLSQAGQFEGEVDYNVTMDNGDQSQMNYFLRGTKARMETTMKGHHMVEIIDTSAKKIYMLMPEQKMVMTTDIPDASKMKPSGAPQAPIAKTGQTKTILGRTAYEWQTTGKNGTTSIWGAKDMGFFMMGKGPGGQGPDTSWAAEIKKDGLFPLEVDAKGQKGTMNMVATKIDEKSLDSSLFEVPSDYKDMSAIMQGMGAGMPSGMPKF